MPWIEKEDIKRAKEVDLLTYLKNYEPWELVHVKGNQYRTASHDSLKISNGKWMWWSEGIGGKSAVDYLIKVRGMDFTDAVQAVIGQVQAREPVYIHPEPEEKKELYIPEESPDFEQVYYYLTRERGIAPEVVFDQIENGNLYQTKEYANVAFVGRDSSKNIRLVTLRGTRGSFKNTTSGSDRRFPFKTLAEDAGVRNNVVHLFEAPMDHLSYATLMLDMGIDYRRHNMIALCGIYQPKEKLEDSSVPIALKQHLEDCPYTKTVCLHLDNDVPGKKAAEALQVVLTNMGLTVMNQPPPEGFKDCNDFLKHGAVCSKKNERLSMIEEMTEYAEKRRAEKRMNKPKNSMEQPMR